MVSMDLEKFFDTVNNSKLIEILSRTKRIRKIMQRNRGISNEDRRQKLAQYVRGWINYYSLADMKVLMSETDDWLRRKIRTMYWKQWKKVKTRY